MSTQKNYIYWNSTLKRQITTSRKTSVSYEGSFLYKKKYEVLHNRYAQQIHKMLDVDRLNICTLQNRTWSLSVNMV